MDQNDAELVSNFINGSERAFNEIVRKYQQKTYNSIRKFIHNHDDADDVLQKVYIKIYKGLKNFKGESSLFTWIYRIAVNESFTFIKIKKVRHFFSIDDVDVETKDDNPIEIMEKDEMRELVKKGIEKLPEQQKKVFIMRYYEEMSFKEISKVLKTTEGGLKANYFHAVRKIGEYLKNEM